LRYERHVALGEMRNAYTPEIGKPAGNRPLARPRRRWENVRLDLREIGYEVMDRMHMDQGRDQGRVVGKTVMNTRFPKVKVKVKSLCFK